MKIFFPFLFSFIVSASVALAQTENSSISYIPIEQKCALSNLTESNNCLKNELIQIIAKSFSDEQKKILEAQISSIEKQVFEAELDMEDPMIKNMTDQEREEYRLITFNEILKKLLNDTLVLLENNNIES